MPTLVIADRVNTPESRIKDVVLLQVDVDQFAIWFWAGGLRRTIEKKDLYLFNDTPPEGNLPVNLGVLDWNWCSEGLAVLKLLPPTFQRHFGDSKSLSTSTCLTPGLSLLAALRSLDPDNTNSDLPLAVSIIARTHGTFPRSGMTLSEYLEGIVVAKPEVESDRSLRRAASLDDKLRAIRRISLWTPGTTEAEFVKFYSSIFGEQEAHQLWALSRASVEAVATGNFERQVSIGAEVANLSPPDSVLAGEAAYFQAEGLRLLADIEPTADRKEDLRAQAVEHYAKASALLVDDPRPLRGLGRIAELRGDLDGAVKHFKLARGLCLIEGAREATISELDLAHEILRTSRHFVHCLLDLRATSPSNLWRRVSKEQELQGYLYECENLHLEHMPKFKGQADWYYIEWFMGFVFLAKAWGSLSNYAQMQRMLVKALDARRRILGSYKSLTTVERANLEWWLEVARSAPGKLERSFETAVERFQQALEGADGTSVIFAIEEVIAPFVSPWSFAHSEGA